MSSPKYLALFVERGEGVTIGDDIIVLWDSKKGRNRLLVSAPKNLNIGRIFDTARGDQVQGEGTKEAKNGPQPLGSKGPTGSDSGNP